MLPATAAAIVLFQVCALGRPFCSVGEAAKTDKHFILRQKNALEVSFLLENKFPASADVCRENFCIPSALFFNDVCLQNQVISFFIGTKFFLRFFCPALHKSRRCRLSFYHKIPPKDVQLYEVDEKNRRALRPQTD